ncbi:hypothetical protein FRUB_10008 [Fimbriiglobus ruber]|uniref:Uncharacterized protein n=1 Tax=Fimbriiglobus ruber TaxID=1908690 RepID=A0A225DCX2_9BACT|nr:hypothetical protein FRUB_10008 [Fimbriiglobus ruber]
MSKEGGVVMTDASEYQHALDQLQGAFEKALHGFTEWFAKEWLLEDEEKWKRAYKDPFPGEEFRRGFNAGVESAGMALKVYMDEVV